MADAGRDIIVTGIPRSGTTLTAALIDGMPDTVCLNEPAWHTAKAAATGEGFARFIADDFDAIRKKLLAGTPVPDRRSPSGGALTNYYGADRGAKKSRELFEILPFTRPGLSKHFTLAIKHNGPYLAVLGELIALGRFTIIAVVRHPLHVIQSWRSLDIPISRGQMPNAVPFWPQLAELSKSPMELLEKQVRMYDLMCARLHKYRDHIHLLRYEDLIARPELLIPSTGIAPHVEPGMIRPPKSAFDEPDMDEIAATLRRVGTHYREFYEV